MGAKGDSWLVVTEKLRGNDKNFFFSDKKCWATMRLVSGGIEIRRKMLEKTGLNIFSDAPPILLTTTFFSWSENDVVAGWTFKNVKLAPAGLHQIIPYYKDGHCLDVRPLGDFWLGGVIFNLKPVIEYGPTAPGHILGAPPQKEVVVGRFPGDPQTSTSSQKRIEEVRSRAKVQARKDKQKENRKRVHVPKVWAPTANEIDELFDTENYFDPLDFGSEHSSTGDSA
jgi:hypothetical protein